MKDNKGSSYFKRLKESFGLKFLIIGVMLLLFLIPISIIKDLVNERADRRQSVEAEIIDSWGGAPSFSGPVLVVPYIESSTKFNSETKKYETIETQHFIFLFPERLNIDSSIPVEQRSRGIYSVPVYRADLSISGEFHLAEIREAFKDKKILWDEAVISFNMSTLKGITSVSPFLWDGQELDFRTGTGLFNLYGGEMVVDPVWSDQDVYSYSVELNFNGGKSLTFLPLGKETTVTMTSDWQSPSFFGEFLPVERELTDTGFSARWEMNSLSRNLPSFYDSKNIDYGRISSGTFGVKLMETVTVYLKNERSVKYSWLFLVIPFLTFLLFELIMKKKIHPVQYFLAGAADIVFYLLLLSISEHLGFNISYGLAALATTILITVYTITIFKDGKRGILMGPILGLSYLYLFIVLQSEDYALLLGSIGLFIMVGIVMFITRRIKWYKD